MFGKVPLDGNSLGIYPIPTPHMLGVHAGETLTQACSCSIKRIVAMNSNGIEAMLQRIVARKDRGIEAMLHRIVAWKDRGIEAMFHRIVARKDRGIEAMFQ